jgi:hypothetical protein
MLFTMCSKRHGQDKGAVKPVGHINVLDFAGGNGAEEHNRVRSPTPRQSEYRSAIPARHILYLGVAQRQRNRRQHNDQLPTPKSDGRPGYCRQTRRTLQVRCTHIIRGGKQAAAAKGENHRIGVQGTQTAKVKPRADIRQIKGGANNWAAIITPTSIPTIPQTTVMMAN